MKKEKYTKLNIKVLFTRAEQFLQEKDKLDGSLGEVTEITETNYFFKLSKYQNWLIDHKNQSRIYPSCIPPVSGFGVFKEP